MVGLADHPFEEQAALYATWAERAGDLPGLVAFNALAERCRAEGLGEVVSAVEDWAEAGTHLAGTVRRHWLEVLLNRAYAEREALARFDGDLHDGDAQAFRDLDRAALRRNWAQIAREHWSRLPRREGIGQLGVLRREFEKKVRHLPVRQLMDRAGLAVRAIKPVFLMSPLSVATFLGPESSPFDLVVFDEASQVRPVDALGALLRGRRAVVVGDSRQLPPTQFFDRLLGDDLVSDDEDSAADLESILGLFVAQGAPERMLRWHYRSRHESLIAVSNHEFYDDRLVVFPSPDAGRERGGLVLRHLPDTAYDRGKTRTNPGEADAVARAVMDHAREQLARSAARRLTLGVAAFSMAQMQAILDRLERLRRDDASCEEFFALGAPEPFFVKNLENVQGDERDVIYISVGYGRSADGSLAMGFGPLNGDGGERRLNVLITRARVRCEVFTNLTAADLDLSRTSARGVRALKTFLAYAAGEPLTSPSAVLKNGDGGSPFNEAVRSALTASGCRVRSQIGSSGVVLDLAIVDPDRPDHFLLGLAGDGPSYQAPRSARDRDRLIPQVLEGLGWRLHRVWCPDWFQDPDRLLNRILADLAAAQAATSSEILPEDPPDDPVAGDEPESPLNESEEDGEPDGPDETLEPYRLAELNLDLKGLDLHAVPVGRLASWVRRIVEVEGPVHLSEVNRRILDSAGLKRSGRRIQAALERACEHAIRKGTVRRSGDFLWPANLQLPPLRDRHDLPPALRRLDLVAPEEIALAVERLVADALGIEPAAVPAAACRLLGFPRASEEMRRQIEAIVSDLVRSGRLAEQGEHLIPPPTRTEPD